MLPDGWANVRRILAVRLDNIGDVIMLGPALRTVKRALPEAHITLLATPAGSQVAPLIPWIDDVTVHRVSWQDISGTMGPDAERELGLVETVRSRRYDAVFIFTSFSQSPYPPAYVCYLAGVPLRVAQSREFGGALLTHWVKPLPDDTHQVDRNLHLVSSAGFQPAGRHLELRITNEMQEGADRALRAAGLDPLSPFVVLAPGASAASRRYDAGRYGEVARQLAAAHGLPVALVGSPREGELIETVMGVANGPGVVSLVGRTSVPELVGVVRRAAVVLANNSGPLHMADALGRPMVILFSGTDEESQWAPRFAPSRLFRRPTACTPCRAFRCPYNMECLDIPPADVVEAALELIGKDELHHAYSDVAYSR